MKRAGVWLVWLMLLATGVIAQSTAVEFTADNWDLTNAEVTEYLGRTSLTGTAVLKDVVFENGVIEVDIAVDGDRSYPGINFRIQSPENHESFYVRPHRASGLFTDAMQYTPVINGVSGWQLYSGEGFTGPIDMPKNEWVHLKLEIHGSQARVFIGDNPKAALVIPELIHGVSKGGIGLAAQRNVQAYFSNFSYREDDNLVFDPPPEIETPLGMFTEWELSRAFRAPEVIVDSSYRQLGLSDLAWQKVKSDPSGLVDIARYATRTPGGSDWVYARTTIDSDRDRSMKLEIAYSDWVSVFVNDQLCFMGNSAYRSRHPEFSGVLSLNDVVILPLKKGTNELSLLIGEAFGGWGFMCRDGEAMTQHEGMVRKWERSRAFKYPESVTYDSKRGVLYVSNYFNDGAEFLSKVGLDGEIIELEWVTGVDRPLGVTMAGDMLYVTERQHVAQIDPETGQIVKRYPIPGVGLANDIVADDQGRLYVTDTRRNVIYRLADDSISVWLEGDAVNAPNGLCFDRGNLLYGNAGNTSIRIVNTQTKEVRDLVDLSTEAAVDGLRSDGRGNYLASDFRGRLYLISPSGQQLELLNTTTVGMYLADFEYIPERRMIVIPTLYDHRLVAFEYEGTGF